MIFVVWGNNFSLKESNAVENLEHHLHVLWILFKFMHSNDKIYVTNITMTERTKFVSLKNDSS